MTNSHEWQFDNAWQEMLNHATIKVITLNANVIYNISRVNVSVARKNVVDMVASFDWHYLLGFSSCRRTLHASCASNFSTMVAEDNKNTHETQTHIHSHNTLGSAIKYALPLSSGILFSTHPLFLHILYTVGNDGGAAEDRMSCGTLSAGRNIQCGRAKGLFGITIGICFWGRLLLCVCCMLFGINMLIYSKRKR